MARVSPEPLTEERLLDDRMWSATFIGMFLMSWYLESTIQRAEA